MGSHLTAFLALVLALASGVVQPMQPALSQTQVLKKDVHVFLDVSGTVRNDDTKKRNLSDIVTALLEAEDPGFGGRVLTEQDRVFIYRFSDQVRAFSPESSA